MTPLTPPLLGRYRSSAMNEDFWQSHLTRCPALRPWLERAARVALRRAEMPATLTLGAVPQDRAVRQALDALFGVCREDGGRLKVQLAATLRDRERWLPLAALLDLVPAQPAAPSAAEKLSQALRRVKMLHPDEAEFIDALRVSDPVRRFCGTAEGAERKLAALFEALAVLRRNPCGITLSELGAQCFNDSKALRAGALRLQLEHLLQLRFDAPDVSAAEVFRAAGIVENPLTVHAVAFVPFAYRTTGGAWFDWPVRLWERHEAAVLSWQTVRAIEAVRFEAPCARIVTSENAAPFLRLVERDGTAALYTEGYPNAAVKALLSHVATAGATAQHWGDTDLDGYRIAEQVGRRIPVELAPVESDTLRRHGRPLTPAQRVRTERFVQAHPEFPYVDELRRTLRDGWLEQEHGVNVLRAPAAAVVCEP